MAKISVNKTEDDIPTIGFDLLKAMEFTHVKTIKKCNLCNHGSSEPGCSIKIDSKKCILICNSCFHYLLDILSPFFNEMQAGEKCIVNLGTQILPLSKPELSLFINRLKRLKGFDTPASDDAPNIDSIIPLLKAKESKNTKKKIPKQRGWQKEEALQRDLKALKITECFKRRTLVGRNHEESLSELKAYCLLHDIPCKSVLHSKPRKAVLLLTTGGNDGFVLSFCSDCLYAFASVLTDSYWNPTKPVSTKGAFCIKQVSTPDSYCLFTGKHEPQMYVISVDKCHITVCRKGLELLTKTVLESAAIKEIYPDMYQTYSAKVQKIASRKTAQIIQQYQESKKEIDRLENEIQKSQKENRRLDKKLSECKKLLQQQSIQEKELRAYLKSRVLDCQQNRKNIYNIGVPRDIAQRQPAFILRETAIDGMACKTLNHYGDNAAKVILDTGRKDNFCLSICSKCAKRLAESLSSVNEEKVLYQDFQYGLEIKHISRFTNGHCFSCGNNDSACNIIRIGSVELKLCDACKDYWSMQLNRIAKGNDLT